MPASTDGSFDIADCGVLAVALSSRVVAACDTMRMLQQNHTQQRSARSAGYQQASRTRMPLIAMRPPMYVPARKHSKRPDRLMLQSRDVHMTQLRVATENLMDTDMPWQKACITTRRTRVWGTAPHGHGAGCDGARQAVSRNPKTASPSQQAAPNVCDRPSVSRSTRLIAGAEIRKAHARMALCCGLWAPLQPAWRGWRITCSALGKCISFFVLDLHGQRYITFALIPRFLVVTA